MIVNLVFVDIKRCMKSLLVAAFLLFSTYILSLYMTNSFIYDWTSNPGTLNLYLFATDFSYYNVVNLIGPIFPAIAITWTLGTDIHSEVANSIISRTGFKTFAISRFISTIIISLFLTVVSHTTLFALFFIFDPSPSTKIWYIDYLYQFKDLYNRSMLNYALVVFLNTMLYFTSYAILSLGVSILASNRYIVMCIPMIFYYVSTHYYNVLSYTLLFFEAIPSNSLVIYTGNIITQLRDHMIVALVGTCLYIVGLRRIMKNN